MQKRGTSFFEGGVNVTGFHQASISASCAPYSRSRCHYRNTWCLWRWKDVTSCKYVASVFCIYHFLRSFFLCTVSTVHWTFHRQCPSVCFLVGKELHSACEIDVPDIWITYEDLLGVHVYGPSPLTSVLSGYAWYPSTALFHGGLLKFYAAYRNGRVVLSWNRIRQAESTGRSRSCGILSRRRCSLSQQVADLA